jgi:glutamate carboxypeptidase
MSAENDFNIAGLHQHFNKREREITALTRALVEVESPSGNEAGSKAVVSLLAAAARNIGAINSIERIACEGYGEHLRIKAFDQGRRDQKPILVLGHTDTVHPIGSLEQRPWRLEGNRAYGPGVFDMKANCALAVEVLRACASIADPPRPIVLLLTCDEERGSMSGRSLIEAEAKRATAVLVLEPPGDGGRVKTGRKGTGIFTIETKGLAAHAGLDPEKGASAILEMARQIQRLHEMNSSADGITVNVGVVSGGTVSNVVAAESRAEVDVRFGTNAEAQEIERVMASLRPFDKRVRIIVGGGINRPPLERSEKVMALYERARNIAARLDYELGETQVGGASDGNFAAAVGAPVLDGLGIKGDGAHATHEHILTDDIPYRGTLLAGLLCTL